MLLSSCDSSQGPDYASYKTDIIGVWCAQSGPEHIVSVTDPYYYLLEFTEESLILHEPSEKVPGYMVEVPYTLTDNTLMINNDEGKKATVLIENDTLTIPGLTKFMNNDSAAFRRATTEEMAQIGVLPQDSDKYQQVSEYMEENSITIGTVDPTIFEDAEPLPATK